MLEINKIKYDFQPLTGFDPIEKLTISHPKKPEGEVFYCTSSPGVTHVGISRDEAISMKSIHDRLVENLPPMLRRVENPMKPEAVYSAAAGKKFKKLMFEVTHPETFETSPRVEPSLR